MSESSSRPSVYLIDVSSLFFRAFYSVRPLTSPKGEPVNAVYGLVTMLLKLIREAKPDAMAFCFDRPEPSFRVDIDPAYKANRDSMPDDLAPQIPYIKKVCASFGVPCFERVGFEADDLIGSICQRALKSEWDVVIVSGDKDFGQLVNDRVTLYDTMKELRYDRQGVYEKMGVWPEQVIDYLALVGDASDNVPGVKGIGAKGAVKLLAEFGTLEGLFSGLEGISSESMRGKLQAGRMDAERSRKLVTIRCDLPLDIDFEAARLEPGLATRLTDELREILSELGFKSLLKETPQGSSQRKVEPQVNTAPAPSETASGQAAAFESLHGEHFARWFRRYRPLWVLSTGQGLLLGQAEGDRPRVIRIEGGLDRVTAILEHPDTRLAGYDLKAFARTIGLSEFRVDWDHQLASYVLEAGAVPSLERLFEIHLGVGLAPFSEPGDVFALHLRLRTVLEEKLGGDQRIALLAELDFPLIPILTRMERRGILIDRSLLAKQSSALSAELARLEQEIHSLAGRSFTISSPKQLAQVLFEDLKLPPGRKTKTGLSTDSDVLEGLRTAHPICGQVIEYREVAKLKSTYVDSLPTLADEHGRIHTTFNAALTSTGRLSSTNPNLQNIPIRTPRGSAIRNAFVAQEGHALVSADYSQIELRILAHLSEDAGLMRAFYDDVDIHAATAAEIFGTKLENVSSDQRRQAKAVNFGLAYGQGAFGLAETLGISRTEASRIISDYFAKFPRVKEFMLETVERAKRSGFVETIFGRRRYISELSSRNAQIQKAGERAAINAPIQGSASDLVKVAMVSVDRALNGALLLQVHDELIAEVPSDRVEVTKQTMRTLMEAAVQLKVPLVVNCGSGHSWGTAHN